MTVVEAINRVEDAVMALGLIGRTGKPAEILYAFHFVEQVVGSAWQQLEHQWSLGEVTNEEYVTGSLALLEEIKKFQYRERIEKTLADLKLSQGVA